MNDSLSRRHFLARSATGLGSLLAGGQSLRARHDGQSHKALIAVSLDLEMSRNFPKWEDTHWDYEKGNLDEPTKKYAVRACQRVKAAGGVLHCFAVGRVFEQESVAWLKDIAQAGHPIGNHTYDHVNVKATRLEDVQYRFRRAPWLVDGRQPAEVIRENIRLTSAALKTRVGVDAAGFRTPGGFANGLADRADVRQLLADQDFRWVSSKYPAHPLGEPGREPNADVLAGIVKAQAEAQPFVYPRGLVEVPMSPVSDITAFRAGRWKLEWLLKALRLGVEWAIDNGACFDFLGHPSCLCVTDPEFQVIDLISDLVKRAGPKAALVGLDALAERGKARKAGSPD
jgi:hypothetical protein